MLVEALGNATESHNCMLIHYNLSTIPYCNKITVATLSRSTIYITFTELHNYFDRSYFIQEPFKVLP